LGLLRGSHLSFGLITQPLDLLTYAVHKHQTTPTFLIIVSELLWTAWKERNELVFRGEVHRVPMSILLHQILAKLKAILLTSTSPRQLARFQHDEAVLGEIVRSLAMPTGQSQPASIP
jgi:hypothetical protein